MNMETTYYYFLNINSLYSVQQSYQRGSENLSTVIDLHDSSITASQTDLKSPKEDQEKYIVQLRNVSLFYGQLESKHYILTSQYSRLNETHSELQSNCSRLNTSLSKCKQENEKLSLKSSILDKYCPLPLNDNNCKLCPEKWMQFNGKCYYFSTDNMNWNSSRDNCTSMGGHLVIIESKAEQDFLSSQTGCKEYWIGLNDQAIEGQWRWVDNTTLNTNETYWGKREDGVEPDNYTGEDPLGEDCVHFAKYKNFTPGWYDASCTLGSYQRICETVAAIIKPRYL
ncbi:C-type lectin domain family 4 member E-like isoform X2 [Acipenser ruthenus]|uniref:C-type lectin domain family 4 member E-like isoform X2 n=1 Tax=Acipenser ruthenus TaxID=7906 RepID=UPI0027427EB6|nr:C-type lectin domain family 4 member E-like isoform X2 [Acipenser ruthenus]